VGRRQKVKQLDLSEARAKHREMLADAEAAYRAARDKAAEFYSEVVKPAERRQAEQGRLRLAARDSIDRTLILAREKIQTTLNKSRRRRRELLKDLAAAQARFLQTKEPSRQELVDLVSSRIKEADVEIKALEREFSEADKKVTKAIEAALASLAD